MSIALLSSPCIAQGPNEPGTTLWEISLERVETCAECIGQSRFFIESRYLITGESSVFPIESTAASADRLLVHGDLGVFIGTLSYGGFAISVIDLKTEETVAQTRGYDLYVSDDGRYFIFREWYPRNSPAPPPRIRFLDVMSVRQVQEGVLVYQGTGFMTIGHADYVDSSRKFVLSLTNEEQGLSLLTVEMDQSAGLREPRVCEIPFLPRWPQPSSERPHYEVVSLEAADGQATITLNQSRGITGVFTVGYENQCAQ